MGSQAIGVREYSVLGQAERDLMMRRLLALRVLATGGGVGLALAFCAIAGYDSTIVLGTLVAGIGLLLLVLFNLLSVPLGREPAVRLDHRRRARAAGESRPC